MKSILCIAGLLMSVPLMSEAMPAPRYLSVPQFQACLSVVRVDMLSSAWCLPSVKPAACPDGSWDALQQPVNRVPVCPVSAS